MRVPQTWCDKGLLEDEPFLSALKAHQGPDTGRDSASNRNFAIVAELQNRKLLNVVQAWLDLAFQPSQVHRKRIKAGDPGTLDIFVRYYCALFRDPNSAIQILRKEWSRRGYRDPTQEDESSAPAPKEAPGSKLRGLKFRKNLNGKKDIPGCPEQEEKSISQTCPSSLDVTSVSETRDFSQTEPHSSTLPIPSDSQNTRVVGDLPNARKRRQTSPDSHPVKHRKINEATSDTSKLCTVSNASITQLANTSIKPDNQVTNCETGDICPESKEDTLTLSCPRPTPFSPELTKLDETVLSLPPNVPVPNIDDPQRCLEAERDKRKSPSKLGAGKKTTALPPRLKNANIPNGQSLGKRTKSRDRVDSSRKKRKSQKNPSSNLQSQKAHLSQDCHLPVDPNSAAAKVGLSEVDAKINASAFPLTNSSVSPAIHNSSDRGGYAATSRADPEKGKQGPQQIDGVVTDTKARDTDELSNVFNDLQITAKINETGLAELQLFNAETKTDDSQRHGTFTPRTHEPSQSSSDQCDALAICDSSNSRKRRLNNPDALERRYSTVPFRELSPRRPEQATVTSHRGTKRYKVVQKGAMAESGKEKTLAPAHKSPRGKKGTIKKQGLIKVESSDVAIIPEGTHLATGLPAVDESLSHPPMQGETTTNPKRRRASSPEDRQNKRQVPADQEDSVPATSQPSLKRGRGRPPKVNKESSMQLPPKKKGKQSPKRKVLSYSQVQLNDVTVGPFPGQIVGIKQETSILTCIPFTPAQQSCDVSGLQKIVEELPRHDHAPLPINTSMKEELLNGSENWSSAQEHNSVEEPVTLHYVAPAAAQIIFPTQKPSLPVNPPIWAQSRQEVCETFDWFRSYQGGVYFAHNAVKGYLLSAFSSKRDRFEHSGRLIISHGGGKAESLHTHKGQTAARPATDQLAQDKSVRALLDNYRNRRPLVLLIDDKYVLFPYDLGAKDMTYVVLGFYTIAHAWAEYQPANNEVGYVVRYKFAFRWCDDQGLPWWLTNKEINLSDLTPTSIATTFSLSPTSKRTPKKQCENSEGAVSHTTMVREAPSSEPKSSVCRLCHLNSPRVYTCSWLCLQPDCSGFWKDIKGDRPPDNLEYDFSFLKLRKSLPIPPDFGKLKPDLPSRLSTDGTTTRYAFTRGFHCNSCGRLSCRFKWEQWECSNCKECVPVSRPAREAKDFWSNSLPINYKDHFISTKSKIEQQPIRSFTLENGMGSIQSFILPAGRGRIHHIQPGTPLGRLEADDIFIEYQRQATTGELKFRRWPLRSHKCRGALLTNYFSQNSGEPYQYVGGTANTVPFENAPGAVVKARALIQTRIQQALGMDIKFNEVLSAAYMERQKMAFHSDNEIGLGPVVAGLSLGSPALMHFRIHAKHDPLRELKGNLLSFVLRHGDILVMDGAGVQEYYEHTVVPNNFRIAATARQINPGHA